VPVSSAPPARRIEPAKRSGLEALERNGMAGVRHDTCSGVTKNQVSFHAMLFACAACRIRSKFAESGVNSPFSHLETVACEVPANAANSRCVSWNTELRMNAIGSITHNTHTHEN
jgi:hypothetical protein